MPPNIFFFSGERILKAFERQSLMKFSSVKCLDDFLIISVREKLPIASFLLVMSKLVKKKTVLKELF